MPLLTTIGSAAGKGFGLTSGVNPPVTFDYLVVAGGGRGGGHDSGGAGGGGYRTSFPGGTSIEVDAGKLYSYCRSWRC